MNQRFIYVSWLLLSIFLVHSSPAIAQSQISLGSYGSLQNELEDLVETPGVSGYKNQLADKIRTSLKRLQPATDNLGVVFVPFGGGAPQRLGVPPPEEPGFVVGEITPDGSLRVQPLPQGGL